MTAKLYSRWREAGLRVVLISGKLWGEKMGQTSNVHRVITAHLVGYFIICGIKSTIKEVSVLRR